MKTLVIACFLLCLCACGGSKKGNWTVQDKTLAKAEIRSGMAGYENLFPEKKLNAFTECALSKTEANYKNFEEADADDVGLARLFEQCAKQLMP